MRAREFIGYLVAVAVAMVTLFVFAVVRLEKPPVVKVVKKLEFPAEPTVGDIIKAFGGVRPIEMADQGDTKGGKKLVCALYTDDRDLAKPPVANWVAQVCYFDATAPKGRGRPELAG